MWSWQHFLPTGPSSTPTTTRCPWHFSFIITMNTHTQQWSTLSRLNGDSTHWDPQLWQWIGCWVHFIPCWIGIWCYIRNKIESQGYYLATILSNNHLDALTNYFDLIGLSKVSKLPQGKGIPPLDVTLKLSLGLYLLSSPIINHLLSTL